MSQLPVRHVEGGITAVVDPSSGELVPLSMASDRALAHAAGLLAEHDRQVRAYRQDLAAELRARHGVGKTTVGGFAFTVAESQSWPAGRTLEVLGELVSAGTISSVDAERCAPSKPRPDPRQLKALIGRLAVSDPVAANMLAEACTLSSPSIRDIAAVAVDEVRP